MGGPSSARRTRRRIESSPRPRLTWEYGRRELQRERARRRVERPDEDEQRADHGRCLPPPHIANNRPRVDAPLVREFLGSLSDRPVDDRTVTRIRAYLEALGRPDVRYLVGLVRGTGAPTMARYARGILEAAGATVGLLEDPLDDPLLAVSGTSVAAIAYQLGSQLGELSRREGETLIAFVAHAEDSRRVLLLTDAALDARAPVHGVVPDVVAVAAIADDDLVAAIADAPERRPFVLAPRDQARAEVVLTTRALPYVLGGRDFRVASDGAGLEITVGDERYEALALGPGDDPALAATGIVTGLAIASFGVRMRTEWVERGAELAAARQ